MNDDRKIKSEKLRQRAVPVPQYPHYHKNFPTIEPASPKESKAQLLHVQQGIYVTFIPPCSNYFVLYLDFLTNVLFWCFICEASRIFIMRHVQRRTSSVVCIATGYGLQGPEIESWCERDFLHMYRPLLLAAASSSIG